MPPGVVVHQSKEAFQTQYGTLWNAVWDYLDGKMPEPQAHALEKVVAPEFICAVAVSRAVALLAAK